MLTEGKERKVQLNERAFAKRFPACLIQILYILQELIGNNIIMWKCQYLKCNLYLKLMLKAQYWGLLSLTHWFSQHIHKVGRTLFFVYRQIHGSQEVCCPRLFNVNSLQFNVDFHSQAIQWASWAYLYLNNQGYEGEII